jgi:hypothetical protein
MDFTDNVLELAERVKQMKPQLNTEEGTKTALIMPFIQVLGYDVFNPAEVIPEFTADVGTKKGEKVDYAIKQNDEIIMLMECKGVNDKLVKHDSQLIRYFHACSAKFAILTNGQLFRFYTDLENHNKMDEKPFFEFDLLDIRDQQINELKKFHKSNFDIQKIISTANELKYMNEVRSILNRELEEPSEAFVKFFTSQVYPGKNTAKVLEQFKRIIQRSMNQWFSDKVNNRLKAALDQQNDKDKEASEELGDIDETPRVITTDEELEGYFIIRGILRKEVDAERIVHRDTQSYFGVLLDDNNRKPICRLHLNGGKKHIELFDKNKNGTKHEINSLDDIFNHSEHLLATIKFYEN